MAEPEIALVFSPERWVEELHRYFTDHGGARVRQIVMDPALALEEEFQTLVVSHRWPALTRALVDALHQRRRRVLGVVDPAEPAGRQFLAALGVDRVIAADATMSEFLEALHELAPDPSDGADAPSDAELAALVGDEWLTPATPAEAGALTAIGGPPGGGATELAIQLAVAACARGDSVVLVDVDEVVPAVAQRLGLPIEPNLRTAVDAVEYAMGSLSSSLMSHAGGFDVVCGLPNVAAWAQVRPGEVLDVVHELQRCRHHVVANVGNRLEDLGGGARGRYDVTRAVLGEASVIVGVGDGTPVGVARLLHWVADVRALTPDAPIHLVVNRAPGEPFKRAEIGEEIRRTYPPESLTFVPRDRRVEAAAWTGDLPARGPFTRAVDDVARVAVARRTDLGVGRATRAQRRRATRPRVLRALEKVRPS